MDARDALWTAADANGQVTRPDAALPDPVRRRMQPIVDACVWQCPHAEAAGDLPPAALPKLCVQGVPLVVCAPEALCTFDLFTRVRGVADADRRGVLAVRQASEDPPDSLDG